MSDFLGSVAGAVGFGAELAALRDFLGLSGLKPGSFRGVPFHVQDSDLASGRRVAVHEFPLRDRTYTEDLGRASRDIVVTAYVIGPEWQSHRDLLLYACEDFASAGTLTLPGGMEFRARCTKVRVTEAGTARKMATFNLTFVEAGELKAIRAKSDTASMLRRAIGRVLGLVRVAFALAYATKNLGDFVRRAAVSGLTSMGESLAGKWLGLPGLDLAGTVRAIAGVSAADPDAPLDAALRPSRALADAGLAMPRRHTDAATGEATTSRATPPPSRGDVVAALLRYALAPAAAPLLGAGVIALRVERNRVALDALARDAATLMAAEVAASTDFASVADARRVRAALLDAIEQRADAAAVAGQDDLFRGWRELAAAAASHMTEAVSRAPQLATYSLPYGLPSLALAHRLYQAGERADELVSLNDPPHPGFLPAAGVALRP